MTPEEMRRIKQAFPKHRDVLAVYEAQRPAVFPLNFQETRRRRPEEE